MIQKSFIDMENMFDLMAEDVEVSEQSEACEFIRNFKKTQELTFSTFKIMKRVVPQTKKV